ncbi:lipid-binding protein [Polaribacter pacificus]|uniref:Lipid-binding protein n=1 Tax=Polaribacter pacificus TaxID=1775173 RepID=A0A917MD61_9FLAO|nr:YceI family protein [Polaribacter pacificus]GGG95933.1 lipid-binding protein [Polaribacter pacificus]
MKKLVGVMLVVAATLTSCKEDKSKTVTTNKEVKKEAVVLTNNVDTENSVLLWKGEKPTGTHNGTVKLKEGALALEDGALTAGEFVINMSTIVDADGSGRLEGHLKSADFFDVEKYPTSKFVITSVENKEGKLAVTGNLTIKDVTKSITIPATISKEGNMVTFKSETFVVNRADFNVKYGSKSFFDNLKDKFINDDMELSFTVKAAVR